uniref:Ubiquitin/ribosomal protein S30e fusion protein n=1 Tax=Georissus sp. APV-2005 TaxID=292453 RepID=Q4LAX6_9COLE|nr:ubiquitin/ribosomal protein S30e fusion protein [Georissus sp. APV-2005]
MFLEIRGQSTHQLEVGGTETIKDVLSAIAGLENLSAEDVVLFAEGKPVNFEESVTAFENVAIELSVPLLGGKVHGSLARAGKVKGQTPKVDKQEKKKKKTGRAKRRIQYNRRFVNVVATFGRRKGPNSNSDK